MINNITNNRFKEIFNKWKEENLSLKSMKPWSIFGNKDQFSLPKITDIPKRLKNNLIYFQTNYIIIFSILMIYSVITNPWFMLAIGASFGLWMYVFKWRTEPFIIYKYELKTKQKIIVLSTITILLFYYASVGNTIFWLIGATITVVLTHALLHFPMDENEPDFFSSEFNFQNQV